MKRLLAAATIGKVATALFALVGIFSAVLALFPPEVMQTPVNGPNLVDMAGDRMHLSAPAHRVIVFPYVLPEFLTLAQGTSSLLGAPRSNLNDVRSKLIGHVFPELARTKEAGSFYVPMSSDMEEVLQMNPDCVVSWGSEEFVDPFKSAHMPCVFSIRYGTNNQIQLPEALRLLGALLGKQERAAALEAYYARERQQIVDELPLQREAHVIAASSYQGELNILSHPQLWLNRDFKELGVINVVNGRKWGWRYFASDPESILLVNPETIFVMCQAHDSECLKTIYSDYAHAPLKAVQMRRVYRIPEHTFTNYAVEEPLLLCWLAELLYPDMPRGLRALYGRTYQKIYGYRVSDEEIDKVIALKENLQSAGYARFAETSGVAPREAADH
jgi:iron complex transport system substrate-binding protein